MPDITHFKLSDSYQDFILIASDGVFDRLTNEEVVSLAWGFNESNRLNNERSALNLNEVCGQSIERIMKAAMLRESLDNLSVVMIAFKNFARTIE